MLELVNSKPKKLLIVALSIIGAGALFLPWVSLPFIGLHTGVSTEIFSLKFRVGLIESLLFILLAIIIITNWRSSTYRVDAILLVLFIAILVVCIYLHIDVILRYFLLIVQEDDSPIIAMQKIFSVLRLGSILTILSSLALILIGFSELAYIKKLTYLNQGRTIMFVGLPAIFSFIILILISKYSFNAFLNNSHNNEGTNSQAHKLIEKSLNDSEKILSTNGLYSYKDESAILEILIQDNRWEGKTIMVSGFGLAYDEQNAQRDSGVIKDNKLYDDSGMVKIGYVEQDRVFTSVGRNRVVLTKENNR